MTLVRFDIRLKNRRAPSEELLDDLRRVFRAGRRRPLTQAAYLLKGRFAANTISARFGTWNSALKAAGLPIHKVRIVSERELLENLAHVWRRLGRQPTGRDMIRRDAVSAYSLGSYETCFGSWNQALLAFAAFIKRGPRTERPKERSKRKSAPRRSARHARRHARRKINWRLRASVLIRDNCLCRMCGASPAKDPAVTLHVDHIKPWSKGGPTTLANLQTLCSVCNIGKADRAL